MTKATGELQILKANRYILRYLVLIRKPIQKKALVDENGHVELNLPRVKCLLVGINFLHQDLKVCLS
jgi:hypothetical protein